MMLRHPGNKVAIYSDAAVDFLPGTGPFGSAFDVKPFPFATSRRLPSGVTRTEVGYHPTGINPRDRLAPMAEMSNTATLLLHAFATNKVFSSGDNARLFGVEPGRMSPENAAQ